MNIVKTIRVENLSGLNIYNLIIGGLSYCKNIQVYNINSNDNNHNNSYDNDFSKDFLSGAVYNIYRGSSVTFVDVNYPNESYSLYGVESIANGIRECYEKNILTIDEINKIIHSTSKEFVIGKSKILQMSLFNEIRY